MSIDLIDTRQSSIRSRLEGKKNVRTRKQKRKRTVSRKTARFMKKGKKGLIKRAIPHQQRKKNKKKTMKKLEKSKLDNTGQKKKKNAKIHPIIKEPESRFGILNENEEAERRYLEKKLGLSDKKKSVKFHNHLAEEGLDDLFSFVDDLEQTLDEDLPSQNMMQESIFQSDNDDNDDNERIVNMEGMSESDTLWLKKKKEKAAEKRKALAKNDGHWEKQQTQSSSAIYGQDQLIDSNVDQKKNAEPSLYVPPHKRKVSFGTKNQPKVMHRTLNGLLNRLSNENIGTIVKETMKIYQENSRRDVTEIMCTILIDMCSDPSLLLSPIILSSAALITGINYIMDNKHGHKAGAIIIEEVVLSFNSYYTKKEHAISSNLLLILCHFYNFGLFQCNLMYDIIRILLQSFVTLDIELLFLIFKNCGHQLRKDDPRSLKEIVLIIQKNSAKKKKK